MAASSNGETMKKENLRGLLAFMLVVAMIVMASCSKKTHQAVSDKITFTDALGREVTMAKEPERVAALIGSFADIWDLSGGTLCAAPEEAWIDYGLELPDAVNIGGAHSPNLELVLASDPDFVIASASTSSNVDMLDVLESAEITVAYFDVDNFDDYLQMIDICTDLTGRKDLYEENGLQLQTRIETIKAAFANSGITEEERTVLLLRTHSGAVKAKGSEGTILGEMLADLGCINIADSDTSMLETLSVESVIRQNPYHIFVVTMGDNSEKALRNLEQMMESNPAWGSLEAVQKGRLYIMDRALFNSKPNARWAESYEKLSEIFLG